MNHLGLGESQALIADEENRLPRLIWGVVLGRLAGLDEEGNAEVDFPGRDPAQKSTAPLIGRATRDDIGRLVAVMFKAGDPERPMVLGVIEGEWPAREDADNIQAADPVRDRQHIVVEGETLVLTATKELVLQSGKARITLSQDGKVEIRGERLLSRATGVNRIKGGAVQIN